MSKSSQWSIDKFKYCNMTIDEKEVFDGLLLSDGCLSEKSRISARITFGFKPSLTSRNRIRFNKKDSINFLNLITPKNGIIDKYKYKWKL